MSDERPYHRLSLAKAAERAQELATSFLAKQTLAWQWQIGHASPAHQLKPGGRKVGRDWRVLVQWSQEDSILDGGSLLNVDLETGEVSFSEF